MSTTATTYEGFAKPDVGTEENSWGTLLNTIFDLTDARLGGLNAQSVAGSANVTLSTANARFPIQVYTGALTGNISVIVPNVNRTWMVHNNTSGTFSLTYKTSAGTGVVVPQGGRAMLYADGTNVNRAQDSTGSGGWVLASNNLSDLASASTAFSNIKQAATASATGVVELATDGETSTGTDTSRAVTPANVASLRAVAKSWTATQHFAAGTLTSGTSVSWDASARQVAFLTLGTNGTMANPTNMASGATYMLKVENGGTNTLAWGTAYKWAGTTDPVLTSGSGKVDVFSFLSDGTSMFGAYLQDLA